MLPAILSHTLSAQTVTHTKEATHFVLTSATQPITTFVDAQSNRLVQKTATLLRHDTDMITVKKPVIISNITSLPKLLIAAGTTSSGNLIHKLANEQKLNIDSIKGNWKTFNLQTIQNTFKNVQNVLLITGTWRPVLVV